MLFQKQKFFDVNQRGDCWRTCIACILDMNVDDVPNFGSSKPKSGGVEQYFETQEWLEKNGVILEQWSSLLPKDVVYIGTGISNRGKRHACIFVNGTMLWDPHPDNTGCSPDEFFVLGIIPKIGKM